MHQTHSLVRETDRQRTMYPDNGVLRGELQRAAQASREAHFLGGQFSKGESGQVGEGITGRSTASTGAQKLAF